jgi:bacillithiol biosynthesis cysteine-adding enzyme BshC
VITTISPCDIPAAAGAKLYLDYIDGAGTARQFFTHGPTDFRASLEARRAYHYPRNEIADLVVEYNRSVGASSRALENAGALADGNTFCVISGQQVGFLGGPAYTAFKIATTIRLAAHLEETLEARFVPVFWLASEDHDFGEINHTYLIQQDGEIGRVSFAWEGKGRPIAALPITDDVHGAFDEYWSKLRADPHTATVREAIAPRTNEDYTTWHARIWSGLFSAHGLVIVEPRILRPPAGAFMRFALGHADEIQRRLGDVADRLGDAGYAPQLTSELAGQLYTYDDEGFRVRVEDTRAHVDDAAARPDRYSTDAALRPLYADAMLPIVASVLGPGETAYHAMLAPLYELYRLPQPLFFPRKSYTVVDGREAERLAAYHTDACEVLTERLDTDAVFRDRIPDQELELFAAAQRGLAGALAPLKPYLEDIDPSLGRTWAQTVANADNGLERLRERAFKARLSQLGFSKGELRKLQNALRPRGRLQERVLPLSHFMNRYGMGFLDELMSAGDLLDLSHHVLTLESADA